MGKKGREEGQWEGKRENIKMKAFERIQERWKNDEKGRRKGSE